MISFINLITVMRILLAPIIMAFLIFGNYLVCTLLFFIAGLSDFFDGYLARKYNSESQLGEILDPIADKILVVFILIGLSVNLNSYLMAVMSAFIIAREIGVTALRDYAARNNMSNKTKVTFLAKTKNAVDEFYKIALSKGAIDEGSPGARSDGNYYAYVRDFDGNKIAAQYIIN